MLNQIFIIPINAVPATKTMTITIGEGGVDQSDLSKTITIPNLKSIVDIKVDTGNVTYNIEGEKLTINATEGKPSRNVYNEKKYSKMVTESREDNKGNFPSYINYNSEEFIGTLNPYNSPKPIESWIEVTRVDHPEQYDEREFPAVGLQPIYNEIMDHSDGSSYVDGHYWNGVKITFGTDGSGYLNSDAELQLPIRYSSSKRDTGMITVGTVSLDKFKGYRHPKASEIISYIQSKLSYTTKEYTNNNPKLKIEYKRTIKYTSELWGDYGIEAKVYESRGTIKQDYRGTVYKAGYDNYYKYEITIEYIDNSNPEIELSLPVQNSYFGKENIV